MPTVRFSSRAFTQKDRKAAIQDIWGPVTNIDIIPADSDNFVVEAAAHLLPSLLIGSGVFSSYRAERSRIHAAASKDDLIFCLVPDAGWSAIHPGGDETICAPGDIYLNVGDLPAIAVMPEHETTVINVAIARENLAPFVVDLDAVSKSKLRQSPNFWRRFQT